MTLAHTRNSPYTPLCLIKFFDQASWKPTFAWSIKIFHPCLLNWKNEQKITNLSLAYPTLKRPKSKMWNWRETIVTDILTSWLSCITLRRLYAIFLHDSIRKKDQISGLIAEFLTKLSERCLKKSLSFKNKITFWLRILWF